MDGSLSLQSQLMALLYFQSQSSELHPHCAKSTLNALLPETKTHSRILNGFILLLFLTGNVQSNLNWECAIKPMKNITTIKNIVDPGFVYANVRRTLHKMDLIKIWAAPINMDIMVLL